MKNVRMLLSAALILVVVSSALAFKVKTNPNVSKCVNFQCVLKNFSDFQPSSGGDPVDPGFIPHVGIGQCDKNDGHDTCFPTNAAIYANS